MTSGKLGKKLKIRSKSRENKAFRVIDVAKPDEREVSFFSRKFSFLSALVLSCCRPKLTGCTPVSVCVIRGMPAEHVTYSVPHRPQRKQKQNSDLYNRFLYFSLEYFLNIPLMIFLIL
jgi:hypothetical protein